MWTNDFEPDLEFQFFYTSNIKRKTSLLFAYFCKKRARYRFISFHFLFHPSLVQPKAPKRKSQACFIVLRQALCKWAMETALLAVALIRGTSLLTYRTDSRSTKIAVRSSGEYIILHVLISPWENPVV